jgi:hypothetical protein
VPLPLAAVPSTAMMMDLRIWTEHHFFLINATIKSQSGGQSQPPDRSAS